jgi:hypothetical protein
MKVTEGKQLPTLFALTIDLRDRYLIHFNHLLYLSLV